MRSMAAAAVHGGQIAEAVSLSHFPLLRAGCQSAVPTFTNMSRPTMRWASHTTTRLTTVTSRVENGRWSARNRMHRIEDLDRKSHQPAPVRNTDIGTSANEIMKA